MRELGILRSVGFLALLILTLLPATAWAQSATTGAIAGEVTDTTGAVLPGVTVEAASPALIEKVRTGVTDAQGQYRIVDLRPGTYTVSFSLPGFSTVRREGIELNTGFTATVDADLRVGALEETITVSGATPVVDIQNVRTQNVLTRELLDSIPNAKSRSSLAALTLGAGFSSLGVGDVGGSQGETVTQLTHHGTADGLVTVNGMKTSSAYNVATAHRNIFNQMLVQEIVMETSGAGAESEGGGLNINMVPKDGGNIFSGSFLSEYTNQDLQNGNLTDELRARGLRNTNRIRKIYDVGGGLGGPLKKDRLWFYTAHRAWGSIQELAGVYFNKTQDTLFYEADFGRPAFYDRYTRDSALRLTWQATPKQKVSLSGNLQDYCWCYGFNILNPEAEWLFWVNPNNNFMANWAYPVTTRLLVEAGGSLRVDRQKNGIPKETGNARSVLELSTGITHGSRFASTFFVGDTEYGDMGNQGAYQSRASVSYITGSHALKVGFQTMTGKSQIKLVQPIYNVQYIMRNRIPVSLKQGAFPHSEQQKMKLMLGLYAQDQWTIRNLSLNLGVRFDHLNSYVPAQTRPGGEFLGPITLDPVYNVPNWKDINPRFGAAYDLFGDGKTAIKASIGRYVLYHTTQITKQNNPAAAISAVTTRTWSDTNGNFEPDCDLRNRAANLECGQMDNQRFGTPVVTVRYDKDVTEGWSARPFNWQSSVALQHELRPGIGLNVAYYRTWFGNIQVIDNLAVTPADYTQYCVTAPRDARLPGGGGFQVCDLYDVTPSKFGFVDNFFTLASKFGKRRQIYDGVQVGINARFGRGGILSGGISMGQTLFDNCASPDFPPQFCETTQPFAADTQIKFAGAYPLPWDLQASATLQNMSGLPPFRTGTAATYSATNAEIVPSLGRNLAACGTRVPCTAFTTIQLMEPWTQREERYTMLDVRLSRIFRVRQARVEPRIDVYNLFNTSAVLGSVAGFGQAWLRPTEIFLGRFVKFGIQVDF